MSPVAIRDAASEAEEWWRHALQSDAGLGRCDMIQDIAAEVGMTLRLSPVDRSVFVGWLILWGLLTSEEGVSVLGEAAHLASPYDEGCEA